MISKCFVSLLVLMATGTLSYTAPATTRKLTFQSPAKAAILQAGNIYSVDWITQGDFNETYGDLFLAWRELGTGVPEEGSGKPHGKLRYLSPPLAGSVVLVNSSVNVKIPVSAKTGNYYHLTFFVGAELYPSHSFTIDSTMISRNLHA